MLNYILNVIKTLPWVVWGGLWADLCRTGTSAGCPFGRGSQSTAGSQHQRRRKMESEFLNKSNNKHNHYQQL